MQPLRSLTLCVVVLTVITMHPTAYSQLVYSDHTIEIIPITETIYQIICTDNFSVNLIASAGSDGILLVDTGLLTTADSLKEALSDLGNGDLKCILLTHAHLDHSQATGFLKGNTDVFAHCRTADRLSGSYYALEPIAGANPVNISFSGTLELTFNGEKINLTHISGGHTDGDVIVHFTESRLVHLGDLIFPDKFPFADLNYGGNALRYVENIGSIIEMLPEDVRIIAGHGREYNLQDLRDYYDELARMIILIRADFDKGKPREDIDAAKLLSPWESWGDGFITADDWVDIVYQSFDPPESLPSICEPLTALYVDIGIEAVRPAYYRMIESQGDVYDFSENQLNMFGYQLINRDLPNDALTIFELNMKAYPESWNVYDSYAEGLMLTGDKDGAIKYYHKSLQINPENTNAVDMLKRLEESK